MTDQLSTPKDRRQLWADRIAAWKASGLSQQKYCDQAQLIYSTFVYWRSRLKPSGGEDAASDTVSFVPVSFKQKTALSLCLKISNHYSVEIQPGFDPDLLGQIIRAVRQVQ